MHECGNSGELDGLFPFPQWQRRLPRRHCETGSPVLLIRLVVDVYMPSARDRVEVAGQSGLFLVLWVNQEDRRVDLLGLRDNAYALSDVPFAKIRPYQEEAELERTSAAAE